LGPKIDFKTLLADGATVVDVRTPAEFKDGHIKGAINLPLQTLSSNLNKLKKDQVIITCCRSGSRSGMARANFKLQVLRRCIMEGRGLHLKHKKS